MKRAKKPILINVIAVVVFIVFAVGTNMISGKATDRLISIGLFLVFLSFVNLIVGIIRNRDKFEDGPVYLAIAGICLLIGFGVCSKA